VVVKIYSNSNEIAKIPNGGFCVIAIISDTDKLIPQTDFIMNATYTSTGGIAFATKTKLTPKMISDWVESAKDTKKPVVVDLKTINTSGLSGGEVAAIVIGSVIGAIMLVIAVVFFIKWCTYGMMAPVAATKMMM